MAFQACINFIGNVPLNPILPFFALGAANIGLRVKSISSALKCCTVESVMVERMSTVSLSVGLALEYAAFCAPVWFACTALLPGLSPVAVNAVSAALAGVLYAPWRTMPILVHLWYLAAYDDD